jgi:hypothetical protein
MLIWEDVIELRPIWRRVLVVHRSEVDAVEFERQWVPPFWIRTVIRFRFDDGSYARKIFIGRTRAVRKALLEADWPVRQVQFGSTEPRAVREPRRTKS